MNALTPYNAPLAGSKDESPHCPSCGTSYPPGSRFCAADGARLGVPARPVYAVTLGHSDREANAQPREANARPIDGLPLAETLPASTPPPRPGQDSHDSAHRCAWAPPAPNVTGARAARMTPWIIAGRYIKLRTLGDGGQGAVSLVQDIQSGRVLALKQFRLDLDPARCREEIEAAARIEDHAHILKIHELHRDPETQVLFITMEYLEGETLESRLARAELPLAEAVSVLRQASRGLSEMHDKLLVHRDVKPANIMLVPATDGMRVKLMDLGIAKSLLPGREALTQPGWIMGTLEYAAPEQLRGEPVTPAFDVYALGVVAYRLLEGRLPHESTPDNFVAKAIPVELRRLVASMLDDDPCRRPQRMRDVTLALERIEHQLRARNEGQSPRARMVFSPPAPAARAHQARPASAWEPDVPLTLPRRAPGLRLLGAGLALAVIVLSLFVPVLKSLDAPPPPAAHIVEAAQAGAEQAPAPDAACAKLGTGAAGAC